MINTQVTSTKLGDITLLDGPEVELIDYMGSDASVILAARVSVEGHNEVEPDQLTEKDIGLINYLMRERHGSPFEHATFTFFVKAPIFVFREFHRHRIASYNEMSGRYSELLPEFYRPNFRRPLLNVGSSAKPEMARGGEEQYNKMVDLLEQNYQMAWSDYQELLGLGVAKEVARIVLPVGIYSQMYVTMNLRAMMNFLSLRTARPNATNVSRPQYEIQQVAEQFDQFMFQMFPEVYKAFEKNGRVAP